LVRIGEYVADNGMTGEGPYRAARDLLMLAAPRVGGKRLQETGETAVAAAMRIAPKLDGGVLPIQGPPGAGKTHTGAHMISVLARSGKNTGITANSHKVIRNLLDRVIEAADESGIDINCIQKVAEDETNLPSLQFTTDNAALLNAIGSTSQVAAGTAWLWARQDAFEAVDVLFVDEAAQMSLANVLAVSQGAKSVVLLGDPQQLKQPMQGSHPDGTDVSALDHLLRGRATIPADRGLFLEETWRLHPDICAFTSELFYENRLRSLPGLERQQIKSNGRIKETGLRFIPVPHDGNQSSSLEEADQIRDLVADILDSDTSWVDREGVERKIALDDILIIAPYNSQVFELQERLPGARIGTVDKFQGQEAPIVIYSMTTSSHAHAPRGMEFLYSSNRLNVATSRARCICTLVGSPAVFEAECRTPRQMQLANAFCRYLEMATGIAAQKSSR
jgi:superfamily I DNA and/or RNA helicase